MTLHLTLATGSLVISVALVFTPKVRSVVKSVWDWLSGWLVKKASSSPWRFALVFRKKSRKGDEVELGISCQHEVTPLAQAVVPQSYELLKELQPALGCERFPVRTFPFMPEELPLLLPAQLMTPLDNPSVTLQLPLPSIRRDKKRRSPRHVTRDNRGPNRGRGRTRRPTARRRSSPKRVIRRRLSSAVARKRSSRSASTRRCVHQN
jgi:hypothetical protein